MRVSERTIAERVRGPKKRKCEVWLNKNLQDQDYF